MNSECFLMRSLHLLSSRNSCWSSLSLRMILVPLGMASLSSGLMVKVPPALDSSVLLVSVVLGDNSDLFSDEIGGVETDTELTNHADIGSGSDGLHETSGSGLGDGTKVVDEISLSHTNT